MFLEGVPDLIFVNVYLYIRIIIKCIYYQHMYSIVCDLYS